MTILSLARTIFGAPVTRVDAWGVETSTYRAPEGADVDPEGEMDPADYDRVMGEADATARAIATQWEPESPRRAWTTEAEALEAARAGYEAAVATLRGDVDARSAHCIIADDAGLTFGWRVGERVLWSRSWRAAPAQVMVEASR